MGSNPTATAMHLRKRRLPVIPATGGLTVCSAEKSNGGRSKPIDFDLPG